MSDDPESAIKKELRAIGEAKALEDFVVRIGGLPIAVHMVSGSSSSVTFSVAYDLAAKGHIGAQGYRAAAQLSAIRPLKIHLSREQPTHREAKAEGINVEHQTGDRAFDEAVYIDTPTTSDVLSHVLGMEVREAVLALFASEMTSIMIDDDEGNVRAQIVSFTDLAPPLPGRGRMMIEMFARLAHALPPVARRSGEHAGDALAAPTNWLAIVGVIAFFASWPFFFLVTGKDLCPNDELTLGEAMRCGTVGLIGLAVGAIAGVLAVSMAKPWTRAMHGGTSSSGARIQLFLISLFFAVGAIVGSLTAFGASRIWPRD
jgi:hypothetical protein